MSNPINNTTNNSIQDQFLTQARRDRLFLTVFLVNGFQMQGRVSAFDAFTVVLMSDGRQQMIYKHAISTMVPERPLVLRSDRLPAITST